MALSPVSITCNKSVNQTGNGGEGAGRTQVGDNAEKTRRHVGDGKTLEAAEILGLEADLDHIKTFTPSHRNINTQEHVVPPQKTFNFSRDENEFRDYPEHEDWSDFPDDEFFCTGST